MSNLHKQPTLSPLQDLPQEAKTTKATSSASRSWRRYATPTKALRSALLFRQDVKSGSWSSRKLLMMRRWFLLQGRSLSRSRQKWIIPDRSRSISSAKAELLTTLNNATIAEKIATAEFGCRALCSTAAFYFSVKAGGELGDYYRKKIYICIFLLLPSERNNLR